LLRERPHLRFLEGTQRGYVVLDITRERAQADWFFATVSERSPAEQFGGGWLTEAGRAHLIPASGPVAPDLAGAPPAPAAI
jgi:alkaline phosphatase D